MAITISFGNQKGGCGKSTTTGIIASMLSQDYKVLVVDMDGQVNVSQMLTGIHDSNELAGQTIFDAIVAEDATSFIRTITPTLDLIVGDEYINTLPSHLYQVVAPTGRHIQEALRRTLAPVEANYDYILIDTPPALGDLTYNSLTASDFVVVMFEPGMFCYSGMNKYFETIDHVNEHTNSDLKIVGILRTLVDFRLADNKHFCELIKEKYPEICLESIIPSNAVVGRVSALGLFSNNEMKQVRNLYDGFYKELMNFVNQERHVASNQ